MNRQDVTERACLIAMTQRDMCRCSEEHSLMSSVCKALDESSNQMSLSKALTGKFNLLVRHDFWSVLRVWCKVEPINSPFTQQEMRDAVAEAFKLARKELREDKIEANSNHYHEPEMSEFEMAEMEKECVLEDDYGKEINHETSER